MICVPSGNFGNITAGLFGKKMGLPVKRFIAANNRNDIFYQYLQTGKYNPRPSVATIANAMDVGDPSNFARVLDLYGCDLFRDDIRCLSACRIGKIIEHLYKQILHIYVKQIIRNCTDHVFLAAKMLHLIAKLFYLRPVFFKHLAFLCIKSHDNRRAYAL